MKKGCLGPHGKPCGPFFYWALGRERRFFGEVIGFPRTGLLDCSRIDRRHERTAVLFPAQWPVMLTLVTLSRRPSFAGPNRQPLSLIIRK